jgi:hypothetical protein
MTETLFVGGETSVGLDADEEAPLEVNERVEVDEEGADLIRG